MKEEQDKISAVEMAKQLDTQKKQAEESQKAHDEFIKKHIELAKKQKEEDDAKAKVEAEKMA